MKERHCVVQGQCFHVVLRRLGGQTILKRLYRQFERFAGDLGRVAVRPILTEQLLPRFVAGLQLVRVLFHGLQQCSILA